MVTKKTYDYEGIFGKAAQDLCFEVAKSVVETIRTSKTTPHRTGTLRFGYKAVMGKRGKGAKITNEAAQYWIYVEYGTRNQKAQPHVRPAMDMEITKRIANDPGVLW